jgi:D-3-phosphoglycerate dehydrogenase
MPTYKVVVTARSFGQGCEEPAAILRGAGCEIVKNPLDRPLNSTELAEMVHDADALICGNDTVDAAAIAAGTRLQVISRYGVGTDNIDVAFARARGIAVTNTPGTNENSVADHTMALILACARDIPKASGMVRGGKWARVLGVEVWQKTLGVLGTGRIGRGVVRRARGFDMRVLCYDVAPDEAWARDNGAVYTTLEQVLREADFLTLHLPLIAETRGLIGARELAWMKASAYLINTARGGILEENALCEALAAGRIAGAALDVLEKEPPPAGSLLPRLENVLITGHMAGYTTDAVRNMGVMAALNVVNNLKKEHQE